MPTDTVVRARIDSETKARATLRRNFGERIAPWAFLSPMDSPDESEGCPSSFARRTPLPARR